MRPRRVLLRCELREVRLLAAIADVLPAACHDDGALRGKARRPQRPQRVLPNVSFATSGFSQPCRMFLRLLVTTTGRLRGKGTEATETTKNGF